jgi:hypothetical protein
MAVTTVEPHEEQAVPEDRLHLLGDLALILHAGRLVVGVGDVERV